MKLAKTKKWTHSHSIVWQIVIIFPIKSDDSITIEFDNPSSMSQFISLEKQVLMKRRKSNPKFKVIWKWGRFLPYWLRRINISLSSLQKEINGQNILTWCSAEFQSEKPWNTFSFRYITVSCPHEPKSWLMRMAPSDVTSIRHPSLMTGT